MPNLKAPLSQLELFLLGIAVLLLALALNHVTIAFLLTPDWHFESFLYKAVIIALQCVTAAMGVLIVLRKPQIARQNLLLLLGSGLFALLIAVVAVEVFYQPQVILSGWSNYDVDDGELNQLGHRGQAIGYSDEDFVIVLLGDSQVEARACSRQMMPERRLEHHLRVAGKRAKVFSVSAGGWGQDQQLLAMRKYFSKYRADMVLLWQTLENDIFNNIFPTHWPTDAEGSPKPTFWLADGKLLGPTEAAGENVNVYPLKILSLFPGLRSSVLRRDTFWEARLPEPFMPLATYAGEPLTSWQEDWNRKFGWMREENLENEKSHLAVMLSPRSARMDYGVNLTRALIAEIKTLSESKGASFALFFAVTEKIRKMQATPDTAVQYFNGKYYPVSGKQFKTTIDELQEGFVTYPIEVTPEDWAVSPEDPHLNQQAVDLAMRDLAKMIITGAPPP